MSNIMCLMRLIYYYLDEEKDYDSVVKYADLFYEIHDDKKQAGNILYNIMSKYYE